MLKLSYFVNVAIGQQWPTSESAYELVSPATLLADMARSGVKDVDASRVVVNDIILESYSSTAGVPYAFRLGGDLAAITNDVRVSTPQNGDTAKTWKAMAILKAYASENGPSYLGTGSNLKYHGDIEGQVKKLAVGLEHDDEHAIVHQWHPCYPRALEATTPSAGLAAPTEVRVPKNVVVQGHSMAPRNVQTVTALVSAHVEKDAVVDLTGGIRFYLDAVGQNEDVPVRASYMTVGLSLSVGVLAKPPPPPPQAAATASPQESPREPSPDGAQAREEDG